MKIGLQIPTFDWPGQRAINLPRKLAILREHCLQVGRPYDEIERTVLGSIYLSPDAMSADQVVETCHELAEMGIQHVIYNMPDTHTIRPIEQIASAIIPRVSS